MKSRILVIDDEAGVRLGIRAFMEDRGFEVDEADSLAAADQKMRAVPPDAVILDFKLQDGTALELLPRIRAADPSVPVLILTAHASLDIAVQAVKQGADQFLMKPVELAALEVMIRRLIEAERSKRNQAILETRGTRATPFIGTSAVIRKVEERARRLLEADSPILVLGETGTGKGVLARWIHENGPRSGEPFVDLNCAGLSPGFLETELFGHEKGAFTGAVALKMGLFEVAHRGTLFLDEIGDVEEQVQPKLLKVIEDRRFRRLGHARDHAVDARLVLATHHDLGTLVRTGKFRQDLYFRISTLPLTLPPLRERAEDIPPIVEELSRRLSRDLGRGRIALEPEALEALQRHSWPGNVRELRNVLERAVLLGHSTTLGKDDLLFDPHVAAAPAAATVGAPVATVSVDDSDLTLEDVERRHIALLLAKEGGRVETAARRLGIPRSTLYQRIRELGLGKKSR